MTGAPALRVGLALLGALLGTAPVAAQQTASHPNPGTFTGGTPTDLMDRVRAAAAQASGLHLVISRAHRRIRLKDGAIVLHEAEVAVGKGGTLEHAGQAWDFSTPVGRRIVLGKEEDPIWVPPDWHYVELAREGGYDMVRLERGRGEVLSDGSRLAVRGDRVEWVRRDGRIEPLPPGEEIIFDGVVYIPPIGTVNRRNPRELGRYKLDLGNGYLIHGTPREETVGTASTHGCIRLREVDLELLYRYVPVGTPVYIH